MARIGRLANLCRSEKLTPDWHRIGMDWHGLARIGTDWHGLARIGKLANLCRSEKLTPDWHRIGTDWHGLARIGWDWHGLANWRICVKTKNWPLIGTGLAWIDMD